MRFGLPKDRPTQLGWALGIFFSCLTVVWWLSSLFPHRELSPEGLITMIIGLLATVALSLYLMHINYD